ncbi:MAG: cobalamin B12-binding domain-containing protein [Candidatus Sumerlaeia bacterium]|nr:cobalamin B12-binding domain-containing protein [Candidatus Sumerlaeia bacterium]
MPLSPPRILLAKLGLDGHDRGVKVIARALRDAGMEVIYTGLRQTPESVARAALEEDVAVVGASLLSGAHMTLVPRLLEALRRLNRSDVGVLVGGIIPSQDARALAEIGVRRVLGPGTALSEIIAEVHTAAGERVSSVTDPDASPGALARRITRIDDGLPHGSPTPDARGASIAVTGPPGVGKSTLVAHLAVALRARGERVAIVAVDPDSPVSGGALLGDRLRMAPASDDPDIFIRSLSARGGAGGISRSTGAVAALLRASGFDRVLIETVGAGQADHAVSSIADLTILTTMPGLGDGVQWEKAGLAEVAGLFVINKADLPGVEATESAIRGSVGLGGGEPVIVRTVAAEGQGVDALATEVERLLAAGRRGRD